MLSLTHMPVRCCSAREYLCASSTTTTGPRRFPRIFQSTTLCDHRCTQPQTGSMKSRIPARLLPAHARDRALFGVAQRPRARRGYPRVKIASHRCPPGSGRSRGSTADCDGSVRRPQLPSDGTGRVGAQGYARRRRYAQAGYRQGPAQRDAIMAVVEFLAAGCLSDRHAVRAPACPRRADRVGPSRIGRDGRAHRQRACHQRRPGLGRPRWPSPVRRGRVAGRGPAAIRRCHSRADRGLG